MTPHPGDPGPMGGWTIRDECDCRCHRMPDPEDVMCRCRCQP